MRRISSRSIFFTKRIFPLMWFGFLAFAEVSGIIATRSHGQAAPLIVVPLIMATVGYVLMKKLVFDLADEVIDDGDALIVRFGDTRERIELSGIINVSYSLMVNPQRVTLLLRNPGSFGREVSFSPRQRFWPWRRNPIVDELIERVDAARRRA